MNHPYLFDGNVLFFSRYFSIRRDDKPKCTLFTFESKNASSRFINPLSPGVKLQILLLCFHAFLTEAVKISIELNLSDHVLNSHELTNG